MTDLVQSHPLLTDMLVGGAHPFPADMEAMLRRIYAHDPSLIDNLDRRYFPLWQSGQDLSAGRALLTAIAAYVSKKESPQSEPHEAIV